jgi:hypothetical protein
MYVLINEISYHGNLVNRARRVGRQGNLQLRMTMDWVFTCFPRLKIGWVKTKSYCPCIGCDGG